VSVQIKALEVEVGARLFERDRHHVFLTQAGKRFQQHARSILSLAETAKIEARCAEAGELGELNVGYSASAMFSDILPAAIRRFRQQFPYVVLTLHDVPSLEQLMVCWSKRWIWGFCANPRCGFPLELKSVNGIVPPLVVALQQDHPLARRPSLVTESAQGRAIRHLSARGGHRPLLADLWTFARTRDSGRAWQEKCWNRQRSLDWLPPASASRLFPTESNVFG